MILQEGTATSLAAPIRIGESISVVEHRRIPIETDTDAVLQIRIGEQGVFRQVNGSTIPQSWRDAAEGLRHSRGFAVILGDGNVGKSTICTYLSNTCLYH